jgi:hypothetical protein
MISNLPTYENLEKLKAMSHELINGVEYKKLLSNHNVSTRWVTNILNQQKFLKYILLSMNLSTLMLTLFMLKEMPDADVILFIYALFTCMINYLSISAFITHDYKILLYEIF